VPAQISKRMTSTARWIDDRIAAAAELYAAATLLREIAPASGLRAATARALARDLAAAAGSARTLLRQALPQLGSQRRGKSRPDHRRFLC